MLPKLDKEAVDEWNENLHGLGLTKESSKFLSLYLPCEYLQLLSEFEEDVRSSKMKEQLEKVQIAARSLERALIGLSPRTIGCMKGILRDEASDPDETNPLQVTERMFFTLEHVVGYGRRWHVKPETLFALSDLADAARVAKMDVPKDRGGEVSGHHDGTGAAVRKCLVVSIRMNLRRLKKPFGSQKGGPVSELLRLIHRAATGEAKPPHWGDRFAEMAPRLELEYVKAMNLEENWTVTSSRNPIRRQ
jgi:hypothetical protein